MPTTQNLTEFFFTIQPDCITPKHLAEVINTIRTDEAMQRLVLLHALIGKNPLEMLIGTMALGFCLGQVWAETRDLDKMLEMEAGGRE